MRLSNGPPLMFDSELLYSYLAFRVFLHNVTVFSKAWKKILESVRNDVRKAQITLTSGLGFFV